MPVQPLPEFIAGLQPPGNRLGIRQGRFLPLVKLRRFLEVQQVIVLRLSQALRPRLLRPLIAAILALHRP
jgi:hypothetical protein